MKGDVPMNNDEIQKIIYAVSKELEINYDKNKTEHYGLSDGSCGTDTWTKVFEHMKANTK